MARQAALSNYPSFVTSLMPIGKYPPPRTPLTHMPVKAIRAFRLPERKGLVAFRHTAPAKAALLCTKMDMKHRVVRSSMTGLLSPVEP